MRARAIKELPERPVTLTPHRRAQILRGSVQAVLHEGLNFSHCLEVSTTGALGKLYLSRQNLDELRRMIAAAEEAMDALDERNGSAWLRPPQKLVF
jgi:hypothetical protein